MDLLGPGQHCQSCQNMITQRLSDWGYGSQFFEGWKFLSALCQAWISFWGDWNFWWNWFSAVVQRGTCVSIFVDLKSFANFWLLWGLKVVFSLCPTGDMCVDCQCKTPLPPGCNCDPEVIINLLCCWLLVLIDFAPSTTITINNYRPLLKTQRAPPQKLVSSVVASNRSSLLNLSWSSNSGFTKRVTFIFTQVGSLFPNLDF